MSYDMKITHICFSSIFERHMQTINNAFILIIHNAIYKIIYISIMICLLTDYLIISLILIHEFFSKYRAFFSYIYIKLYQNYRD